MSKNKEMRVEKRDRKKIHKAFRLVGLNGFTDRWNRLIESER